ncbi:MAG: serine/threonine protein kinase [Clostridia bacterium]|nr:serine/threonine protein kinase [Clostridia bacterium]
MIGVILDRKYRILEEIGSGGMAKVYKAVNMTNRKTVAIKMLKSEFKDDTEFLRRFSREAGTVMKLSHENIVRAYEVGDYEGLPYIVMEYVEGHTLKELIDSNGPFPIRTAIGITCQILDALTQAHEIGIIHRDVKPQNVIVTDRGKAKLTDFGIAREANATTSTFSGKKVLGSVHYISPEQAKNAIATEESDLYSVGITLYEMLTGTVPFTSDSTVAIALMHIQDKPRPPKELNPAIPNALNDIVMRALEKDASKRYESARAMRTDLVRSIGNPNGTFVRDRTNGTTLPSRKTVSVYLMIALGVFIPILAIVVGLLIYTTSCQKRPADPTKAETETVDIPMASESPVTVEPTIVPMEQPTATPALSRSANVIGLSLDDALIVLQNANYSEIYVTFTTEKQSGAITNSVVTQTNYEDSPDTKRAELVVYRASLGSYHADVSFTFTPPESGAHIRIVYESTNYLDIPYRVIVHETDRPYESTDVTVAATVYCYDPVTRQLILNVNGEDLTAQAVAFTK